MMMITMMGLSRLFPPLANQRSFSVTREKLKRILATVPVVNAAQGTEPLDHTRMALTHMRDSYPNLYAVVYVHNSPFMVAPRDLIWTHRIKDVNIGDVIRLDKVKEVGCSEGTIRGRPLIRHGVSVTACVIEHDRGIKVKAKRGKQRKGRRPNKTIKPHTTLLRVRDIKIDMAEVEPES